MNKLKKSVLAMCMASSMLLAQQLAFAEVVTVTGYGADEAAAVNDAKRNAVEQVVGTVLKSKSTMQDLELVKDIVKTRTQGYVNSFEMISKKKEGTNVSIKAKVDVSSEPNSALLKDIDMVMSLNDPVMAVTVDYYGDDNGNLKKYPEMTAAAIHEELVKSGFTHIIDHPEDTEYMIIGNLTVNKAKAIKLPNWSSIGDDEFKTVDTGFSKTTASLDCKIKRTKTNEIIGKFHVSGDNMASSNDDVNTPAVSAMASKAAKEVKKILAREASKTFYDNHSDLD